MKKRKFFLCLSCFFILTLLTGCDSSLSTDKMLSEAIRLVNESTSVETSILVDLTARVVSGGSSEEHKASLVSDIAISSTRQPMAYHAELFSRITVDDVASKEDQEIYVVPEDDSYLKYEYIVDTEEWEMYEMPIYNPATDEISVECTITFDDRPSETFTYIPTNTERSIIYNAMNDYCIDEEGLSMKQYCKNFLITEDTLMNFLKSEIPFRLNEILNLSADKDTIDTLIAEVYANSDVMFNYDRLDSFILSKHSELINEKPPLIDILKDASTRTAPPIKDNNNLIDYNKEKYN